MTLENIIAKLYELGDKDKILLKEKKFGVVAKYAVGVYHKDLNMIAKTIGLNSALAVQLFDSGIYEAKLLCSKVFNPKDLTEGLMEQWVKTFENWEICDSFCMGLFAKSKLAIPKAIAWSSRDHEYEKRAGFVTMAAYCIADKKADNVVFEDFFPIIKREAHDDRLYVKKAVNWALRSIGKRNIDLNKAAITVASTIVQWESKSAKWIAKDALRELTSKDVNILDYPRNVYRKTRHMKYHFAK